MPDGLTRTQAKDHSRVTEKYKFLYSFMSQSWDYSRHEFGDKVNKDDLLDFVLFSWGKACRKELNIKRNFDQW